MKNSLRFLNYLNGSEGCFIFRTGAFTFLRIRPY